MFQGSLDQDDILKCEVEISLEKLQTSGYHLKSPGTKPTVLVKLKWLHHGGAIIVHKVPASDITDHCQSGIFQPQDIEISNYTFKDGE